MSTLVEILGSIVPSGGGSTAEVLFGSGLASLATGSPAPLLGALASSLYDLFSGGDEPPSCRYDYNPLGIDRVASGGDLADFFHPLSPELRSAQDLWKKQLVHAGPYPTVPMPFKIYPGLVGNVEKGLPLFHCPGSPPEELKYPFESWWSLVQLQDLRQKSIYPDAWFWASWKVLTREEARRRYQLELEPFIQKAKTLNIPAEKVAALEELYGGRFVDNEWRWGGEELYGVAVERWPRWIPLDQDAKALREIYARAYFEQGLTDQDWLKIAELQPGARFEALEGMSNQRKRKAISEAYVIAAAKAKGDPKAFEAASLKLRSLEKRLGFVDSPDAGSQTAAMLRAGVSSSGSPVSTSVDDWVGALPGMSERASSLSESRSLWPIFVPAGIAVGTFSMIALSVLRKKR